LSHDLLLVGASHLLLIRHKKYVIFDFQRKITNLLFSAVFFEEDKFEECIKECEKAVEVGRENSADFQQIAK
jgi:hypothetical protein